MTRVRTANHDTLIQDNRLKEKVMRSLVRTLVATVLSFTLVPASPAQAATNFTIQAGSGSADNAVQAFQFYPDALIVNVGDSVTWTLGSGLVHTVSFGTAPATLPPPAPVSGASFDGAGFVSSGTLPPGKSYTLTFPKVGTFNYLCRLHQPVMKATAVVQPAGLPYPATQSSYTPIADPRLAPTLAAGQAALAAQTVAKAAGADRTSRYALNVGFGDGKSFGLMRFGANHITVRAGDSVVWTQNDPAEVHTVTFLDNGKDVDFETDPAARRPAGGSVYAGTGFFNSGVLNPGKAYTLTFNSPGVYAYQCLVHDDIGMKATITVVAIPSVTQSPAQIPVRMPSTGAGGIGAGVWNALTLLGLLIVGLGGICFATRRS